MSDRARNLTIVGTIIAIVGGVFGFIQTVDSHVDKHVSKNVEVIASKLDQDRKDIDSNKLVGKEILTRIGPIESDVKVTRNDISYIKDDLKEIKAAISSIANRRSE